MDNLFWDLIKIEPRYLFSSCSIVGQMQDGTNVKNVPINIKPPNLFLDEPLSFSYENDECKIPPIVSYVTTEYHWLIFETTR